jgi:ech hydrogenase subunit F
MSQMKMAKVVSRSVLSRPATRLYPFEKRSTYKNTRGSISVDIDKCIFCSLCQKKCPTAAIVVKREEKLWEIDRLRCISCGACVDACPKKCLTMENTYSPAVIARGVADVFRQEKKSPAPTGA